MEKVVAVEVQNGIYTTWSHFRGGNGKALHKEMYEGWYDRLDDQSHLVKTNWRRNLEPAMFTSKEAGLGLCISSRRLRHDRYDRALL